MRFGRAAWMGAALLVLAGSNAIAQERGQVGLTMGYPTAIGVVWHATDRVGVKGEFNFALGSSEIDPNLLLPERETHTDSIGLGIAGQFYFSRNDNVSTYVSPRFAYAKITSELDAPDFGIILPVPLPSLDVRTESSSYSFAGSFGAQYSPNRRFSVFGELGLDYSWQDIESSGSSVFSLARTESSTFGVRSAVGIIFYFN
jgi:lipopolysaccharide assembly outer membrane protein LptD (OstA)